MLRVYLGLLAGLASSGCYAADGEFSGVSRLEFAADGNAITKARLELVPLYERRLFETLEFHGSVRTRIDLDDSLAPGGPSFESYSSMSKPLQIGDSVSVELRDFYIDWHNGDLALRLGKQQIAWGQLDGYKLIDQVNPQSLEEFVLEDFDGSRIGLWSIKAQYELGSTSLELVLAPDSSVANLPAPDGLFTPTAPRYLNGINLASDSISGSRIEKGDNIFADATYAVRLSKRYGAWDVAVSAMTGLDHLPLARLDSAEDGEFAGSVLTKTYRHRTLVGANAATSLGSTVLRMEAGYFPSRNFNARQSGGPVEIVSHDQITVALAADYDAPGGLFLSGQLIYDRVLGLIPGLTRPRDDLLVSFFARQYFANETIRAEVRWYGANGLANDGLLRAKAAYQLDDDTELSAAIDIFYGQPEGLYGQFSGRDQLSIKATRYF